MAWIKFTAHKSDTVPESVRITNEDSSIVALTNLRYQGLIVSLPEMLELLWEYRVQHQAIKIPNSVAPCTCDLCKRATPLLVKALEFDRNR